MRGTAANVGVTSTTMLRLARHLGFDSYEDFKAGCQQDLLRGAFVQRAGALHSERPGDRDHPLGETILAAIECNIARLRSGVQQNDLDALAELIRNAPEVHLIGSGSLFWLAAMMQTTGSLALPNLRAVGAEYSVAAEAMSLLGRDDMVIGFGINPIARRTVEAMEFARARGAQTVAITDRPSSPIAEGARFVFACDTSSPHYYPSLAALMGIVDAILATVVATGGERELTRIRDFEATRKQSGRFIEF